MGICFYLSVIIALVLIVLITVWFFLCLKNENKYKFQLAFVFLALFSVIVLGNVYMTNRASLGTFFKSLYMALNLFVLNGNFDDVRGFLREFLNNNASIFWKTIFKFEIVFAFLISPLVTVTTILSMVNPIFSRLRYNTWRFFGKTIYVFSDLNEESITLAEDLHKRNKKDRFVFTDVFEQNSEYDYELISRVERIGAICIKDDLLKFCSNLKSNGKFNIFVIGKNENENISQTLNFIDINKNKNKNIKLYLFSTSDLSEYALDNKTDNQDISVIRVDYTRSLVYHYLYEYGADIINAAKNKKINIVSVGFGKHGIEMVKALVWFCQIDGYELRIDIFDKNENTKIEFENQCPELIYGEYNINFHCADVNHPMFFDEIALLKDVGYIFISLGDDNMNIKTAKVLRQSLWLKNGNWVQPIISTVVFNSTIAQTLTQALNNDLRDKRENYNIQIIGDYKSVYNSNVIIGADFERIAKIVHGVYKPNSEKAESIEKENNFYREYNYRSSVAAVVYYKMIFDCKLFSDELKDMRNCTEIETCTNKSCKFLAKNEHTRWNAYVRTEGYCCVSNDENSSISNATLKKYLKRHPQIEEFEKLDENKIPDEIRYDIGTIKKIEDSL